MAWYWLKNAGDGSHFSKKDVDSATATGAPLEKGAYPRAGAG
jgi:hypothetical protein